MAQYYKLTDFKPSDFQDRNTNYWCTAAFEGVSEPVTWVMRAETVRKVKVGEQYYGDIREYTSAKGKSMQRFYKETEPEKAIDSLPNHEWTPENPERQQNISRSVALNDAALIFQGTGVDAALVIKVADDFFGWLQMAVTQPKNVDSMTAEQIAEEFGKKDPVIEDISDEPINLDDIPF